MRVSFGAVAFISLIAVPASGQQLAGPRLAPSGVHYDAEPPHSGAASTTRPILVPLRPAVSYAPVDSNDARSCNENELVAGAVGAAIGAVWGYNRDQHTVDNGFLPHGGLILGFFGGGLLGINVVLVYNIVTHCGSSDPSSG